jgi:pimeloyl-ACP methyl ester carboxylesterase
MSLSAEEFRAHLKLSAATACRMPDGRFMWKYDQRHRGRPADPDAYARRRELLWSAVDTVECPTLVVRGAQSDVFHDEDAEALASRL